MKDLFERAKEGDITILDDRGKTPLHYLAWKRKVEVLNHKDVFIVKDDKGRTPLHELVTRGKVLREWIREKHPWFKLGKKKITKELISEILNTQNACKFIEGIK